MKKVIMTTRMIMKFKKLLIDEEKSSATIEKYMRDIQLFYKYLDNDKLITKAAVVNYKEEISHKYRPTSLNSMLVSLNRFLDYINVPQCKVKLNKIQKSIFGDENKEMTKREYQRLLVTAKNRNNEQLYMLLQTICATGIRVSEHQYITVEALKTGKATVINKGKVREIFIPKELRKVLKKYCHQRHIETGSIFISKYGNPLNRSNIWSAMKSLCIDAEVDPQKVFPHNLRHLFATTYYQLEKDLDTLASLLGHTSINTTRIYTMKSSRNCIYALSKMNLCMIC